jgi:hypothetical protein
VVVHARPFGRRASRGLRRAGRGRLEKSLARRERAGSGLGLLGGVLSAGAQRDRPQGLAHSRTAAPPTDCDVTRTLLHPRNPKRNTVYPAQPLAQIPKRCHDYILPLTWCDPTLTAGDRTPTYLKPGTILALGTDPPRCGDHSVKAAGCRIPSAAGPGRSARGRRSPR